MLHKIRRSGLSRGVSEVPLRFCAALALSLLLTPGSARAISTKGQPLLLREKSHVVLAGTHCKLPNKPPALGGKPRAREQRAAARGHLCFLTRVMSSEQGGASGLFVTKLRLSWAKLERPRSGEKQPASVAERKDTVPKRLTDGTVLTGARLAAWQQAERDFAGVKKATEEPVEQTQQVGSDEGSFDRERERWSEFKDNGDKLLTKVDKTLTEDIGPELERAVGLVTLPVTSIGQGPATHSRIKPNPRRLVEAREIIKAVDTKLNNTPQILEPLEVPADAPHECGAAVAEHKAAVTDLVKFFRDVLDVARLQTSALILAVVDREAGKKPDQVAKDLQSATQVLEATGGAPEVTLALLAEERRILAAAGDRKPEIIQIAKGLNQTVKESGRPAKLSKGHVRRRHTREKARERFLARRGPAEKESIPTDSDNLEVIDLVSTTTGVDASQIVKTLRSVEQWRRETELSAPDKEALDEGIRIYETTGIQDRREIEQVIADLAPRLKRSRKGAATTRSQMTPRLKEHVVTLGLSAVVSQINLREIQVRALRQREYQRLTDAIIDSARDRAEPGLRDITAPAEHIDAVGLDGLAEAEVLLNDIVNELGGDGLKASLAVSRVVDGSQSSGDRERRVTATVLDESRPVLEQIEHDIDDPRDTFTPFVRHTRVRGKDVLQPTSLLPDAMVEALLYGKLTGHRSEAAFAGGISVREYFGVDKRNAAFQGDNLKALIGELEARRKTLAKRKKYGRFGPEDLELLQDVTIAYADGVFSLQAQKKQD